jgi:SAM-dependent methyltransferase
VAVPPLPAIDYATPGVGARYGQARALPAATLAAWADAVAALLPGARPGRIVDLGAGTGRFAGVLADRFGGRVVAVEPSLEMLCQPPAHAAVRGVAARGEALPLRAGTADLVFLSMVYHYFPDPAVVVAEVARVLAPGGHAVVRTVTRENLDGLDLFRFFPEARAIDEARMPARAAVRAAFAAGGLAPAGWRTVAHKFADGPADYARKIGLRMLSSLRLLPDDVFAARQRALEAACRAAPADRAVWEPIDLLAFRRAPGAAEPG